MGRSAPVTGPRRFPGTILPCFRPLNTSRFCALDLAVTYEGLATTLFRHSEPVKKLVWRLQSVERDQRISWEKFLDFAVQKEHIPASKEEWDRIIEELQMLAADATLTVQQACEEWQRALQRDSLLFGFQQMCQDSLAATVLVGARNEGSEQDPDTDSAEGVDAWADYALKEFLSRHELASHFAAFQQEECSFLGDIVALDEEDVAAFGFLADSEKGRLSSAIPR